MNDFIHGTRKTYLSVSTQPVGDKTVDIVVGPGNYVVLTVEQALQLINRLESVVSQLQATAKVPS